MVDIKICAWCSRGIEDKITVYCSDKLKMQIMDAIEVDYVSALHFCSVDCMIEFVKHRGSGRKTRKKGEVLVMANGEEVVDCEFNREMLKRAVLETKRVDRLWKRKENQLKKNNYREDK